MTTNPKNPEEPKGGGNTNSSLRSRKWCFTLNNWTETEHEALVKLFCQKKWTYIIGKEIGTQKTQHLQGYLESKNTVKFELLKKVMPRAHLEKAKGTAKQNFEYCSKDNDYVTNMTYKKVKPLRDPLEGKELYAFQSEVLEIVSQKPDDRTVYWFYDTEGCKGKTTLAKHICMNHNALYVQGKATDIKYGVMEMIAKRGEIDIVIMGLPRSYEQFVSYDAIESVKDGIFYSSKYESGMCMFNAPHVIVLANFPPDESKLSKDRWVVRCLDEVQADAYPTN